jgi:hypothetical protein
MVKALDKTEDKLLPKRTHHQKLSRPHHNE